MTLQLMVFTVLQFVLLNGIFYCCEHVPQFIGPLFVLCIVLPIFWTNGLLLGTAEVKNVETMGVLPLRKHYQFFRWACRMVVLQMLLASLSLNGYIVYDKYWREPWEIEKIERKLSQVIGSGITEFRLKDITEKLSWDQVCFDIPYSSPDDAIDSVENHSSQDDSFYNFAFRLRDKTILVGTMFVGTVEQKSRDLSAHPLFRGCFGTNVRFLLSEHQIVDVVQ